MVYLSWASGPRAEMIDDPLSILMLEDDAADQQLLERELRKHIRQLALTWVTGPQDYERALRTFPFDLILADYNVPGYHGLAALELARRIAPRTPFIVVTGSLDEETAADIVKAGAADYVLKERIARLGPAIGSARERQRMENEKETAVLALRDEQGEAYRMAGSLTDVTRRKEAEERLLHDALHDSLTGLANRTLFGDRLHQAVARGRRRDEYSFAVLYVDLDQFKVVNDSLGHLAGDEVLVALARRLEACLRPGDTVARLGGDEFAVL